MEASDRLTEEKAQLTAELLAALQSIVFFHGKTLVLKMNQTIYRDAYGTEIYDKFFIERDYFIKTVLTRDLPPDVFSFFFPDSDATRIFHDALGMYLRSTQVDATAGFDVTADTTPQEYELVCSSLLGRAGWDTRTTKATGDQGIDVVAEHAGLKLVLQCKLHSRPVGNAAVQEIVAGRHFESAQFAAVVSTADYTPAARELAAATDVHLLHHSDLLGLHEKLGIATLVARSPDGFQILPKANYFNRELTSRVGRPINEIVQQAELLIMEMKNVHDEMQVDCLYDQAVQVILQNKRASISLVQRHLRIGYNRAARLLEDMEKRGIVGPMQSNGNREILFPK